MSPRPRSVLLLAGDVREPWQAALERAGCSVRTTGWLDGVTAARLDRPDAVVVSADLPENAAQMVLQAFRAPDLNAIPVLLAGFDRDAFDRELDPAFGPDLHLPAPVDPDVLAREAAALATSGRPARTTLEKIAGGVAGAVILLLLLSHFSQTTSRSDPLVPPIPWRLGWPLASAGLLVLAAAAVVAALRREGERKIWIYRSGLGWGGALLLQSATRFSPGAGLWPLLTFGSAAFLAWAGWAWLGQRIRRRTPAGRRWLRALAALCAVAAAAPWIVFFVYG